GLRRRGVQAAIAWPAMQIKNRNLSFKSGNGTVNERLAAFDGCVIDQEFCGKVIRTVNNDVIAGENLCGIPFIQFLAISGNPDGGVEIQKPLTRCNSFILTDL